MHRKATDAWWLRLLSHPLNLQLLLGGAADEAVNLPLWRAAHTAFIPPQYEAIAWKCQDEATVSMAAVTRAAMLEAGLLVQNSTLISFSRLSI